MAKTTFPPLIHVTEETPANGVPWLEIHTDGVFSLEEHGQAVALYQLVRVGRVQIQKAFIQAGKPRRAQKKG